MSETQSNNRVVADSQMQVIEKFLNTMCPDSDSKLVVLSGLIARMIVRSSVVNLWTAYAQGNYEETNYNKDQLELLFHNHDAKEEPLSDVQAIFTLMATGKKDGKVPSEGLINFLPSGFWTMSDVKFEFTAETLVAVQSLIKSLCYLHYELPEGWEDEKHPEGLYISPEDQLKALSASLMEMAGEIQMAEATAPSESDSKNSGDAPSAKADEDEAPEATV